MNKNNYIAAIDVGTNKICALIGEVKEYNEEEDVKRELEIIGYGVAESSGIKRGVIVDMNTAVNDIKKAVRDAEISAGYEIESVYLNISGRHIQSINAKGSINISGKNRKICQDDIDRAVINGSEIMIPNDREKLHVLPQEYIVDDQEEIRNPIGMIGSNLELYLLIITVSKASIANLLSCLKTAGLNVNKVVLSHIASGNAVLTKSEKDLGVGLIDIGKGTTDFAIVEKGAMIYSGSIGVGGFNFTNDLAIGIRTPFEQAEKIKRKYGCGIDPQLQNQSIEISSVSGEKRRVISATLLSEILRPRAEEIFEIIKDKVEKQGLAEKINAGWVITGGSAVLKGLLEVADEVFEAPVRIGEPIEMGGLIDKVNTPDFATSIGLLKYGFLDIESNGQPLIRSKGFINKIKEFLGF
jgi:cell division protein FtsA